jgi:pyruvyltransferase
MRNILKKIRNKIESILFINYFIIKHLLFKNNLYKISWDKKLNNFGDILTPFIIENISNIKFEYIEKSQYYPFEHYLIIGSILDRGTKSSIVWGAGLISEDSEPIEIPKKIYAVRGPKTREKLLKSGIDCPEIYGDPALLLPKIYNPKIEKKYELGVIPHYVDKNNKFLEIFNNSNIKIIDIQVIDPRTFIDELLSCKKIASSSLHGLITADAYQIPSMWIEFSDKVVGNGFKFYDYFLSVGRENENPLIINQDTNIEIMMSHFKKYEISIDLDKLINVCPFKINL